VEKIVERRLQLDREKAARTGPIFSEGTYIPPKPTPATTPATTPPPDTTIQDTLAERGKRYGEFKDHAKISQSLKRVMWATTRWVDLPDDTKEALEMMQHKIARVLNGDPEYDDNFRDLVGYSQLVLDRVLKDKKGASNV